MKTGSSDFALALLKSRDTFEEQFFLATIRFCLDEQLDREELHLLYFASFYAAAANISLNALTEYDRNISPEMERSRISLEWSFMGARDQFYASQGWKNMSEPRKALINASFLRVFVADENLAA